MADNRISEIIQNQLPSFFTEEGSNLPLFMTKYFEFLESYEIQYENLELDEYNIVQEDPNTAFYFKGTAIDQGETLYVPSDGNESVEIGAQEGHFFPLYANKQPALDVSDSAGVVYEIEFEELLGRKFYMPVKGGPNGLNYGIGTQDAPTGSYTLYTANDRIVLETVDLTAGEEGTYDEIIVESERDSNSTFIIGEIVVGETSGTELIVTGAQQAGVAVHGNTTPHMLYARPFNRKQLIHGEKLRGKRSRACAYIKKTETDLLKNPLRGAADLDLASNVDEADNYMLQKFRDDFLTNIPFSSVGDLRQAIKTARDIYRARGTEESFRWLWRTVYGNENLEFVYPKTRLLRPSEGEWRAPKSIKVYTGSAVAPDEFGSKIIKGEQSKATATVDNLISYVDGTTAVTELFLTDYQRGYDSRFDQYNDFLPDETVATIEAFFDDQLMGSTRSNPDIQAMGFPAGSSKATNIGVIGGITVVSSGTGYNVNDELNIVGGAGRGAVARVGSTANGAITDIIIDDGGNGYLGGEELIVDSTGTQGTNHTGAIRNIILTGNVRSSNSTIDKVIHTANGGIASSPIFLNAVSFSVDDVGAVRYPENINTHFSSSNTTTFVATVTNQDTGAGGANILLEEGDGKLLLDSTDGSADAGDNVLIATVAFEDDIQPGFYLYDSKTGAKGTIAGPSVNSSAFVYTLESGTVPNFVENSNVSLFYSSNATAVPGKSDIFRIATITKASHFEIEDNQLGDGTYTIDQYYGGTRFTFTPFGSISNVQVITTGIDYIKGPRYEATNQSILGKEKFEFEDPITGKNTGELVYLNFAENIEGKYRLGESLIGQTSGKKVKVIQPYINSTANSTHSTMKVQEVDTQIALEDTSIIQNNFGTFEDNTNGLYTFSSAMVGGAVTVSVDGSNANVTYDSQSGDAGNNSMSIESSNTIYGSYSGKVTVQQQKELYVGLKGLNSGSGGAYETSLTTGTEYIGRISFRSNNIFTTAELRYGSSVSDNNFISVGPNAGLSQIVLQSSTSNTVANTIYTYQGKFTTHPTNQYHALYLYANTATVSDFIVHVDKLEIINTATSGRIELEGFNAADNPGDFMILDDTSFTAGETMISLSGLRSANTAASNTFQYELLESYGNNATLKSGALKTGAIKSVIVAEAGVNYSTAPVITAPTGDNNATFQANRTALTQYEGRFANKLGMLSDIIRIQDSYYYQDFSYILKSDVQIGTFRDIVRSFVHPAGWAVFGEIAIVNEINVTQTAQSETLQFYEIYADRTPSFVTQYGPIDPDMRNNGTSQSPYTSVDGQINFDSSFLHNYKIQFLDPLTIGLGADTTKKNFAFHLGRTGTLGTTGLTGNTAILNGIGYTAETGLIGGPEEDRTNTKNESVLVAPWYPNALLEYHVERIGNESAKAPFGPEDYAQRPGTWGMGSNPNTRNGGIEHNVELGILGKYTSPDGNVTMPLVTTHVSYGEETIEKAVNQHVVTVVSWKEPTLPVRMATASLPNLTSLATYVDVKYDPIVELGILGKYRSPDGTFVMPTISTHISFGEVTIDPDSVANLQIQGTVLWKNPIFPVRMITGSMPNLTGVSTYVVADRTDDKDTHIVQPNITVDRTITTANNFAEVELPSLNVDTSYLDTRGVYGDPHYEYGQSYVRPKDIRVNNILRGDNKFEVAVAPVKAGHVVGLRTDGTIQQVYHTANVLFPRINYVHSLLGIAQSDAAVGEFVEVRDTNSIEERVFELTPGAEYYPNYSANSSHGDYITTTPPTVTSVDSLDRVKLGKANSKDGLELSFPKWQRYLYQAHEAISEGQVVGLMSNGKVQKVFCESDGTAKPQLDGVHSLLGIARSSVSQHEWVEVAVKGQTIEMATFYQGGSETFTWSNDLTLYVDYQDASIKGTAVQHSNHPLNVIGKTAARQRGTEQEVYITANTPVHGTYSPSWDETKATWPFPHYSQVSVVPAVGDITFDSIIEEFRHLQIEAQIPQNATPVENILNGDTVLFDDINIIMEDDDGLLLTGPAAADPSLDFTGDSSSDLPGSASGDTADDLKLAYGSNIFVACDDRKLFSSTDGDTWTERLDFTDSTLTLGNRKVDYSTDTFYLTVTDNLYKSTNGTSWTSIFSGTTYTTSITSDGNSTEGSRKIMAAGVAGTIRKSSDGGSTWSGGLAQIGSQNMYALAYGNQGGTEYWVTGSYTSTHHFINYSSNFGTSWTTRTSDILAGIQPRGIVYTGTNWIIVGHDNGGTDGFIAVGSDITGSFTDKTPAGLSNNRLFNVKYYGGTVFAVGVDVILASKDHGATWTIMEEDSNLTDKIMMDVAWDGSSNFIAVGDNLFVTAPTYSNGDSDAGDEILLEDGLPPSDGDYTSTTSLMGKLKAESNFLIYEDLINSGSVDKRINIYSRFDAKYIVGNLTTENFNVHERDGTYFPEGLQDSVAQHVVLE